MPTTAHRHEPEFCAPCDIGPFARNNYFTGKLLLERDFTDEQRYLVDKLRHHNRRLHGWGVVCGLRVVQHATPGCRDRFICIEPGTALDCCGHEIVVREQECIDFTLLPAVKALTRDNPEPPPHTLQICLRYEECGTEPVPVLYDECGCDDTRCLPNRILESFTVDVVVDPPTTADEWTGATLVRNLDIGVANASLLRFNQLDGHLYVVAGTTLHDVDTASRTVVKSHDLTSNVYALEVSPGGTHLYAVRDDGAGGLTLTVVQASDFSVTSDAAIPGGTTPVGAAVSPAADGRFLVLLDSASLLVYGPDLENANPAAPSMITVPANRTLVTISAGGAVAYVAGTGAVNVGDPAPIEAVDLSTSTIDPSIGTRLPGVQPAVVSTVTEGTHEYLAVADEAGSLWLLDVAGTNERGPVALAGAPVRLAGAPWMYALETAGGSSRLQAIGVPRLATGVSDPVGPVVGLAGDAHDIAVGAGGTTLYVAYTVSTAELGGIAVFDVAQHDCADLLNAIGCDDCDEPNCVVVATIRGYRPGFAVLDAADPPTDPDDDLTAEVARIDNRAGRRVLPSTWTLTEIVKCLLDRAQGAPGEDGKDGKDGKDGEGLEAGLTRITALSWEHDQPVKIDDLRNIVDFPDAPKERHGVVVAFTDDVNLAGIDPVHVFQVEVPDIDPERADVMKRFGLACRCPVAGTVVPVEADITGNLVTLAHVLPAAATTAKAIAFVFSPQFANTLREFDVADVWVRLRGDFVIDTGDRAIDAEFVRHSFDTGDHPAGSAFGVQGGIFESWFEPRRD